MAHAPTPELARRIRAAAAYSDAGSLDAFRELTEISHGSLYRVLRGERPVKDMELRQMAMVAGLPLAFFTGDFNDMQEAATRPVEDDASLREALERLPKPPRSKPNPRDRSAPRKRREAS